MRRFWIFAWYCHCHLLSSTSPNIFNEFFFCLQIAMHACGWGYTAQGSWSHSPIHRITIIAKREFLLNRLTCCNQSMLDFIAHHQTMHRKQKNVVVGYEKGWICLWNVFGCCLIFSLLYNIYFIDKI